MTSGAGIPDRCADGAAALTEAEAALLDEHIDSGWSRKGTEEISRRLEVRDFQAALDLVNAIGAAAEDENHHPDLCIEGYRNVRITLSTHDAGGLSANDYVMARRTDALV